MSIPIQQEKKQLEMEANASKNGKLRVSVALKDVMVDYEGYGPCGLFNIFIVM